MNIVLNCQENGPDLNGAEFGARGDPWPTTPRVVRPYLEELYEGVAGNAVVEVVTLEVERTFWEKLTLLHATHHGTLYNPDKRVDCLSRHVYDIHRMWQHPEVRQRLLADPGLLQRVVKHKAIFFKEGKARYDLVEGFILNAAPHGDLEVKLRDDYRAMASMFFPESEVPEFDTLLVTLGEVEAAVATWRGASG